MIYAAPAAGLRASLPNSTSTQPAASLYLTLPSDGPLIQADLDAHTVTCKLAKHVQLSCIEGNL